MNTQLIITLNPDGSLRVDGPIDNKILAYGMLEAARDAIREHLERKAKGGIVVPRPVLNFPNNGG